MAKNTVSLVWDIAEPIAEELGLVLWDVVFENITCKNLSAKVTTGDASLKGVRCTTLTTTGTTGDVAITDVVATSKFIIERDTGDVTFDSSDANEICKKHFVGFYCSLITFTTYFNHFI